MNRVSSVLLAIHAQGQPIVYKGFKRSNSLDSAQHEVDGDDGGAWDVAVASLPPSDGSTIDRRRVTVWIRQGESQPGLR